MTYLLQRGKQYLNTRSGLDGLVHYDYMGSAEFEFGALGESLKRMRQAKIDNGYANYTPQNFRLLDDPKLMVTVCSPCAKTTKERNAIINEINLIAQNKIQLKEPSFMNDFVSSRVALKELKTDFWWAIDSDYMFWVTRDGTFSKAVRSKL